MTIFGKKRMDDGDVDHEPQQIKDLKPENKRARKEPFKPWGKRERLIVLAALLITVLPSGFLALSARNFKLPRLPRFQIPKIEKINPFKEQVVIIGDKENKISQEKLENIKEKFRQMTNSYSGIYAFYIYDLKGDYYYGLNYQDVMQAASLIKLPVMYLAMKEGQDKDLVEAMGKRSDNNAFNKMVNILGKENINKVITDLGMINTSLAENLTTPEEIGLFFKKLHKIELLNEVDTLQLEEFMTDTAFESWLRLGIPDDVPLTHKYGREVHAVNDAGIVLGNKPFVLVIMTDGVIEKEADELFPKLTELLYNEHTNEKAD